MKSSWDRASKDSALGRNSMHSKEALMNRGYVEPSPVPQAALHPYSFPFESVDPICEESDGLHVTSPDRLCVFTTGQAPWEATRKG